MRLTGLVETGEGQAGGVFNLPTANMDASVADTVKPGVYAAQAFVGSHAFDAITFIGRAELLTGKPWRVETHLFDYQGLLVGQTLTVDLLSHLRDPMVFTSAAQAKEVMVKDLADARLFFSSNP